MSRRDQIRMTDEEVRDLIRENKTIIINSIGPDGFPHPMPMWFSMDDAMVVSMTTFRKSQKILNLQRDPRVSLLVDLRNLPRARPFREIHPTGSDRSSLRTGNARHPATSTTGHAIPVVSIAAPRSKQLT